MDSGLAMDTIGPAGQRALTSSALCDKFAVSSITRSTSSRVACRGPLCVSSLRGVGLAGALWCARPGGAVVPITVPRRCCVFTTCSTIPRSARKLWSKPASRCANASRSLTKNRWQWWTFASKTRRSASFGSSWAGTCFSLSLVTATAAGAVSAFVVCRRSSPFSAKNNNVSREGGYSEATIVRRTSQKLRILSLQPLYFRLQTSTLLIDKRIYSA